jgi:hypothetical protein
MHERIRANEWMETFVRSSENVIESDNRLATGSNVGWGGASGLATFRDLEIILVMVTRQLLTISWAW